MPSWTLAAAFCLASIAIIGPSAAADDQQGINQACSREADRLGLAGPERYDFRAKCKGHGQLFSQMPAADPCRQIIVENGISGRALAKMKTIQGHDAARRICEQMALVKSAQTTALSIIDGDPNHCRYSPEQIQGLRDSVNRMAHCASEPDGSGI